MNAKSPNTLKHTPGPWKMKDIFRDNAHNLIGVFGPRSASSGFGGFCVAHVEKEIDARLIAEAPAMYEALKACLPDLQHYAATHGTGPDSRLAVVQAVLARIEGRGVTHV